jgi:hypothetical protein
MRTSSICRSSAARGLHLAAALLTATGAAFADVRTVTEYQSDGIASFKLGGIPAPARKDAASAAKFSLLDGTPDANGGTLDKLHDGTAAREADDPERNFFFAAGTAGGRLLIDLERTTEIRQINTYSWHPTTRGPQVYRVFGSDGSAPQFNARPNRNAETNSGWTSIAAVDTRNKGGGQHAVSVSNSEGSLGKFRYLLFDIETTDREQPFGNTFYSEIDVVDMNAAPETPSADAPLTLRSADDHCEIAIDTSEAPELREWAETRLGPVVSEWYPKLAAMLPSEGYEPPKQFSISIRPMDGVAHASGTRISASSRWLSRELNGEAIGAIIHEIVHVLQLPNGGRRNSGGNGRAPGWLVEGIPDYIRFFLFEPQTHGADLTWLRARPNVALNYDARYRVTANFLNYVVEHHDPSKTLIARINAACRERRYSDDLWAEYTGKPLAELNEEWKAETRRQLAIKPEPQNTLSEAQKRDGWQLLFNGVDFNGWKNFKRDGIRPGWQVRDGVLICADPKNAGDLVTTQKFDAFELELEYNIAAAGNSGILFHVTDEGGAVWATGPEFQLEDNARASDPQRCGWLYGLYQPPIDPATGKPLDATKPAGEWNHVRLLVSPEKCEHVINGKKYFDYVIGSDDFNRRVAASKFSRMPLFAKSGNGYLALQGDHGQVSFRNIRVRRLPQKPTQLQSGLAP